MVVKYCKAWLLILAVMIGASVFGTKPFLFLLWPVMLAGLTAITLLAYDERSGWTMLSRAMPYTRAQLVSAKYLVVLLLLVVAVSLAAAAQLARIFMGKEDAGSFAGVLFLLLAVGLLVPAVLLPLVFRFGVEKARIVYFVVFGFATGCMVFVSTTVDDMPQLTAQGAPAGQILLAAAVLFALSWLLSIRAYRPHV